MMTTHSIILIGGGGHCRSCIDVIRATGAYTIKGIVDQAGNAGGELLGVPFIGTDDDLPALVKDTDFFLVTVGQIRTAETRRRIYATIKELGGKFPVIISPLAYVSAHASVGEGTIVMHHALVNAASVIGINGIINSKALAEHDVRIGDHCHIATAAVVNGEVQIGDGSFIGSHATVRQGVRIGRQAVIGAGSVVLHDVPDGKTVTGNPGRIHG